jgi:hypothetical protein
MVEKQEMISMALYRHLCYGDFEKIPYFGG